MTLSLLWKKGREEPLFLFVGSTLFTRRYQICFPAPFFFERRVTMQLWADWKMFVARFSLFFFRCSGLKSDPGKIIKWCGKCLEYVTLSWWTTEGANPVHTFFTSDEKGVCRQILYGMMSKLSILPISETQRFFSNPPFYEKNRPRCHTILSPFSLKHTLYVFFIFLLLLCILNPTSI